MLFSTALNVLPLLQIGYAAANPLITRADIAPVVNSTECNDARDKLGDTIGGIGSAIALDSKSWKSKKGKREAYEGIIYGLPDRGWNTQGTQNTQSRIHKFSVSLDIVFNATAANPAKPNFQIKYLDTILLYGPDGTPTTGLDADANGFASFKGFPDLPVATYTGDGFGGPGEGGKRVSIDAEGLVLGDDGSFYISDEYGPYIYQFDKRGKMIEAIRPPDAFIPIRNGTQSFNAASPPIYDSKRKTKPEDPTTGRANNQGLEALTASPDGKYLYALLQSSTMQEGGDKSATRRNTRFLKYRVKKNEVKYEAEYIVQLPLTPGSGKVAGQSEIHYISETQFLILARDSGAGHGQDNSESKYRNADVFDISKATNIKSTESDAFNGAVASRNGTLNPGIKPATYCPWLSYNNNEQLNKFGAHNGGPQDAGLLNEKWESFALGPIDDKFESKGEGKEYYLISFSDNDFITQNGFINGGKNKYADGSGFNLDTQVLVFKVRLPKGSKPL